MIVARGRATRLAGAVAVAVLLSGAAGCGSSVPASPPTGVDQLVVPTPSPRPSDYVARIDNPWLAWTPGEVTTYEQTGSSGTAASGAPGDPVSVEVGAVTTTVAGLPATTLTTTVSAGVVTVDWFAQDRAGNVWWLGRQGEWTAGQDGAEAGLWMPASPRVGDGFRQALAPGVVEDVATVTAAPAQDAATPEDPETVLEVRTDLEPGALVVRTYAEGSGLVRELRSGADAYLRSVA